MVETTKRRFTDEFKLEAVALWKTEGRLQTEMASDLCIVPTMLRHYGRCYATTAFSPADTAVSPTPTRLSIQRINRCSGSFFPKIKMKIRHAYRQKFALPILDALPCVADCMGTPPPSRSGSQGSMNSGRCCLRECSMAIV